MSSRPVLLLILDWFSLVRRLTFIRIAVVYLGIEVTRNARFFQQMSQIFRNRSKQTRGIARGEGQALAIIGSDTDGAKIRLTFRPQPPSNLDSGQPGGRSFPAPAAAPEMLDAFQEKGVST